MSRPKSKAEIQDRLEKERQLLELTLSKLSQEDLLFPNFMDEWTIKDILAHLADWEAHMLVWVEAGRQGEPVISPGYDLTWDQLDVFNQHVFEAHCQQSLEEVFAYFRDTHEQFMLMVEEMPIEELLTPGKYPFLGTDSVHSWLVQYADHDRWATDHIQEWVNSRA